MGKEFSFEICFDVAFFSFKVTVCFLKFKIENTHNIYIFLIILNFYYASNFNIQGVRHINNMKHHHTYLLYRLSYIFL